MAPGLSGAEYVRQAALGRAEEDVGAPTKQDAAVTPGLAGARAEDALGNIGYVKRIWEAFAKGGVAAIADLVDDDVIWRPRAAQGHALRGTRELADFHSSAKRAMPALRMFRGNGDDVLVEAEYASEDGDVTTVWLLYRFDGQRLVEAIALPDEGQARTYSPPSASD